MNARVPSRTAPYVPPPIPGAAKEPLRIVVTGGDGMVALALYEKHPEWTFLIDTMADLRDPIQTYSILRSAAPDIIVHLANLDCGMYARLKNECNLLEDALLINTNVVRAARRLGVRRFIAILEPGMYPATATVPYKETDLHNGPPHASDSCRAIVKRALHTHLKEAGFAYMCLVAPNLYGPYDTFDSDTSNVVAALITRAVEHKYVAVRGSGKTKRQFMYAPDFARILEWAVTSHVVGTFNVAAPNDTGTAISDVAKIVAQCVDLDESSITYNEAYEDGRQSKVVDAAMFEKHYGIDAYVRLRDGIQKTVAWYAARCIPRAT